MAKDEQTAEEQIRALLAKAESTGFGPEAEALVAKAQEMMARWNIDEVRVREQQGKRDSLDDVIVKQVRVSSTKKHVDSRRALLHQLAKINHCNAIIVGDFLTVLGFERDVENTTLLYTNLSVQMLGSLFEHTESSNTNWADNFCFGFVDRVTTRLRDVRRVVEEEVKGTSTALVLVNRDVMVEDKTKQMFPNLTTQHVKKRVYDPTARAKGAAAADNADIGQTGIGNSRKGIGQG